MSLLESHLERLGGLAAGLCLDAGVRVEASEGRWCYDPVRRVIRVGKPDLLERGADYCAGVLAHEVGHYHISRYHLIRAEFPSRVALAIVLNGIEDPRVNTWIKRRYPGTTRWYERLTDLDALQPCVVPLPATVRFALESAREELIDWQPADAVGPVPEEVLAALEATRAARRRFAELLPPDSLLPTLLGDRLAERYRSVVEPVLNDTLAGGLLTAWEKTVRISVAESMELARSDILPVAARLWQSDVDRLARHLEAEPRRATVARAALSAGPLGVLGRLVHDAFREEPAPAAPTVERIELARQVLECWLEQVRSADTGRLAARPLMGPVSDSEIKARVADSCDKAQALVADQIDRLAREIEEVLLPRRRLGMRGGYPSGRRLDLRRAMAFDADVRLHDRLWSRPTIPRRRDSAFLLLVDLSGSMRGEKTDAALAGTWLLAGSLARLEVPFAIFGFQDVLIPFIVFGNTAEDQIRAALAGLPEEVNGARLGGNNCPEYNDDGPCVLAAAEELLSQPARQHVLIVVSDGLPEGRRSIPEDLHRAVGELSGVRGLRLVGIGLGPNTEHVRNFYPESIANVRPARLADEIGGLLRRALKGRR
jgi:hypothetical protein